MKEVLNFNQRGLNRMDFKSGRELEKSVTDLNSLLVPFKNLFLLTSLCFALFEQSVRSNMALSVNVVIIWMRQASKEQ